MSPLPDLSKGPTQHLAPTEECAPDSARAADREGEYSSKPEFRYPHFPAFPQEKRRANIVLAVRYLAAAVFVGVAGWGLVLCLEVVFEALGVPGVVLGIPLFPLLLILAPWYALIGSGNPTPILVCFGGAFLAWSLVSSVEMLFRGS